MKVGLVGYAGSGKSTIFGALAGVPAPIGSTKVQLATVKVPDARLERLAEIYQPKKITTAEITCVDVPGRALQPGQGLDSATLETIRDVSALALVVGAFAEGPAGAPNVVGSFASELVLADLLLVERRLESLQKQADREHEKKVLARMAAHLQDERALRTLDLSDGEREHVRQYAFVSDRPLLVIVNVDEGALEGSGKEAAVAIRERGYPTFVLSGPLEIELNELEPDERQAFLEELGLNETGRDQFIRACYEAMDLITFLTGGDREVHAWPIRRGSSAQKAAGRIHTDLERGFIRAEVFHFDDIDAAGSEAAVKAAGKWRLEGRDYVVQDGDVMLIRHSG